MVFYLKTSYLAQIEGRMWLDATLDQSDQSWIDRDIRIWDLSPFLKKSTDSVGWSEFLDFEPQIDRDRPRCSRARYELF